MVKTLKKSVIPELPRKPVITSSERSFAFP
jgi:hypothetical protein